MPIQKDYDLKYTEERYFVYDMQIKVDTYPFKDYAEFCYRTTWPKLEYELLANDSPIDHKISVERVPYECIWFHDDRGNKREVKVAVHPDIAEFFRIRIKDFEELRTKIRTLTYIGDSLSKSLEELQDKPWHWHLKEAWRKLTNGHK